MDPNQRPKNYEFKLIVVFFITWGVVFLDRMSPLYLAPFLVKDLHFDNTEIGLIGSALSVGWGLSAVLFGSLADKVGRRPVLLPSIFILSALSWVTGLARNFGQMFGIRFLMGASEGVPANLLLAVVEEESPAKHRGRNVGIVQSAAGLVGLAVAPVLVTQIAARFGWQDAFYLIAIPGIIMGLIMVRFVREPAKHAQALAKKQKLDYASVLRERNIWLIILSCAGFVTWLMVTSAFAPVYLTEVDKFSPTEMGWVMSALGLSGFLWGFGVPWISDRIGRKPALIIFGLASAIVPLSLLFVSNALGLAAIGLILAAGQGLAPLVTVVVPAESVKPELVATGVGLSLMVGELLGGTLMPSVAGALADKWGLSVPMLIASGGALVVVVLAIFLKETAPRFAARHDAEEAAA